MQPMRLELDSNVRRDPHGTALLGGSPFRLIRLSAAGAQLLDTWLAGASGPESTEATAMRAHLIRAGIVHPKPGPATRLPTAAFVIPTYENAAGLAELLASVRVNFPAVHIVVVDDASDDVESTERVADAFDAQLLRHHKNQGPAAARNTGWRHLDDDSATVCRPEVVVFIDTDVVPTPGALAAVLRHLADTSVAAAAPRVRAMPGTGSLSAYEATNSPLDLGPSNALVFPGTSVSYVPTAAFAIRLDALRAAGGFDESMRFGEDVDLIWRLADNQSVVRYVADAVVHHQNRSTLKAFARQRLSYGSSAATLARGHRAKVAPLQSPSRVVAALLGAVFGNAPVRIVAGGVVGLSAWRLSGKLAGKVERPRAEALRLTAMSHRHAIAGLASAATRCWAPLMSLSRRTRPALLASLVIPAVVQWARERPAHDPVTQIGLRAVDHGAYCAGVWRGVWSERSLTALLPYVREPNPATEYATEWA